MKITFALAAVAVMFAAGAFVVLSSDDGSDAYGDEFTEGDLVYRVTEGNEVDVVDVASGYGESIVIPSTVTYGSTTYHVTGIGSYAFADCTEMTSITIPDSVNTINSNASTA